MRPPGGDDVFPDDPNEWEEFETDDGRLYYHCEATGKTTWTQPEFV